jgi:hypothetical protein
MNEFRTDFVVTSFGSVVSVKAVSEEAREFANANLPVDGWQGNPTDFYTDWRPGVALGEQLQDEGWAVKFR